jgi:hypothetical protein
MSEVERVWEDEEYPRDRGYQGRNGVARPHYGDKRRE